MKRLIGLSLVFAMTSCGWFRPRVIPGNPVPPCGPGPTVTAEIPYAQPVPEREGYVISPYHNKVVDCQGLARDTLVYDPYDTTEPRRKFRVP
jgi:hypothetical protein